MKKIRIRLLQISVSQAVEENLAKLERAVAAPFKPGKTGRPLPKQSDGKKEINHFDFIMTPELFTTGYRSKKEMRELSEDLNGKTVRTIKRIAKQYGINFAAGSYAENKDGIVYNTSLTVNKKGEIKAIYRKTHLFTPTKEDKLLSPGHEISVYQIEKITAGTFMCFELRFPEIARKLALLGAELLFCPVEWNYPKSEILFTLGRARAVENQAFLALANLTGKHGGFEFCGGSMVVAPDGTVVAIGSGDREEIIDAEIDLSEVKKYRKEIPALSLRREDLY